MKNIERNINSDRYGNLYSINAIILLISILLAAYLRFSGLNIYNFWADEWISMSVNTGLGESSVFLSECFDYSNLKLTGIRNIFSASRNLSGHGIIPTLLQQIFIRTLGVKISSLRWMSAISGILAVPGIWLVCRRLRMPEASAWAALLMAISPVAVVYSMEGRHYSLWILAILWQISSAYKVFTSEKKFLSVEFIISSLISIFTHYLSIYLIIAEMLCFRLYRKEENKNSYISIYILTGIGLVFLSSGAIVFNFVSSADINSSIRITDIYNTLYYMPTMIFGGFSWRETGWLGILLSAVLMYSSIRAVHKCEKSNIIFTYKILLYSYVIISLIFYLPILLFNKRIFFMTVKYQMPVFVVGIIILSWRISNIKNSAIRALSGGSIFAILGCMTIFSLFDPSYVQNGFDEFIALIDDLKTSSYVIITPKEQQTVYLRYNLEQYGIGNKWKNISERYYSQDNTDNFSDDLIVSISASDSFHRQEVDLLSALGENYRKVFRYIRPYKRSTDRAWTEMLIEVYKANTKKDNSIFNSCKNSSINGMTVQVNKRSAGSISDLSLVTVNNGNLKIHKHISETKYNTIFEVDNLVAGNIKYYIEQYPELPWSMFFLEKRLRPSVESQIEMEFRKGALNNSFSLQAPVTANIYFNIFLSLAIFTNIAIFAFLA